MGTRNAGRSGPSKRGFGPGRNRLLRAQQARGRSLFNIWYHYSARLRRDVILRSDVEFDHFCWLEGDPQVLRYELEPDPVIVVVQGEPARTQYDALVYLRDGRTQLREVKDSEEQLTPREHIQRQAQEKAASAAGFDYVRITRADLIPSQQLIQNWRTALAFLAACRELVLSSYCDELQRKLRKIRRADLETLLAGSDPALRSVYLAALFTCLQDGSFNSDLDCKPLCAASVVWLTEDNRA